jgi:hypothetical protein
MDAMAPEELAFELLMSGSVAAIRWKRLRGGDERVFGHLRARAAQRDFVCALGR